MQESIFTKIIKGDIPSHKIYEDELTLAFLDIHPITTGHTLVVPKTQIEFVWDLNERDYLAVMNVSKKIAIRLREILGTKYISERIVGIDVPHAHVQLIPFNNSEELKIEQDMNLEPDHALLSDIAKKLSFK